MGLRVWYENFKAVADILVAHVLAVPVFSRKDHIKNMFAQTNDWLLTYDL